MLQFLLRLSDSARHRARLRSWSPALASGRRGEDLAHRFLRKRGFHVVARNYRPRSGAGEIDLVAWDGGTLVFVEVKSRRSEEFGTPDRAVDQEKQDALVRAAREYARRAGVEWQNVRFDIVNVVLTDPPSVSHIGDAFGAGQAL
jgi:putative endonuclease